jgi:hypothetical protein
MKDAICIIRKFVQKIKVLESSQAESACTSCKDYWQPQKKALGSGKGVQIFQNSMGNLKILGDR